MNKFKCAMECVFNEVRDKGADAVVGEIEALMKHEELYEGPTLGELVGKGSHFFYETSFETEQIVIDSDFEFELVAAMGLDAANSKRVDMSSFGNDSDDIFGLYVLETSSVFSSYEDDFKEAA